MGAGHFARSASKALILALALAVFLFSCYREDASHRESEQAEGGRAHRLEAMQRERFLASRHGFQFGVPKHAYPRAVSAMRAMERAQGPRRVGTPNAGSSSSLAIPAVAGT